MTNPKLLLQELHWVLRRAWDERTLPASVVPADLVRRIEACLTDEPGVAPEPWVCGTCGAQNTDRGKLGDGKCHAVKSLAPLTPYGEELLERAKLCQCGICEACEFAQKHAQPRTNEQR